MKILALTSIRSEYDLMSSLFDMLHKDEDIELKLLVGGAHNSPSFGLTANDIEADGFDILQVESLLDGDTNYSRLKSASLLLMSSIDLVRAFGPDLIVYAGDREEVLIGAMLGGYLSIPTIHFFGGDHACDGHIDNPVRHAASKMSTCHFVSTEEHKERLLALGEPEYRIHNIGSVALDKFAQIESDPMVSLRIAGRRIDCPAALFIFHPVEEEISRAEQIISDAMDTLLEKGFHVFVGVPNTDHGNSAIRKAINKYESITSVTVYGNLPRKEFVQLFKSCEIIVGNSSAGLLEAASIPIPCVNIGARQRGRLCGANVQFVSADRSSITEAVEKAQSSEYLVEVRQSINPYGSGDASEKAFRLIKEIDFGSILKKKEDPLNHG